jgi:hypothetical protein
MEERLEAALLPRNATGADMSQPEPVKYVYSFQVWPDETWSFDPAVYELFRMMRGRIELEFTAADFERFRSGLSHHGLTLREVERVPYNEPESVL